MTLSPDQVARWILSYHICNAVSLAMDDMFRDHEDDEYDRRTDTHKKRVSTGGNWMQLIERKYNRN